MDFLLLTQPGHLQSRQLGFKTIRTIKDWVTFKGQLLNNFEANSSQNMRSLHSVARITRVLLGNAQSQVPSWAPLHQGLHFNQMPTWSVSTTKSEDTKLGHRACICLQSQQILQGTEGSVLSTWPSS